MQTFTGLIKYCIESGLMRFLFIVITISIFSSINAQKSTLSDDEKISFFLESISSKDYESYRQFEDEIYASVKKLDGYSDTTIINIIYTNFISPNLYDFNQFERAIKYIDFVIPIVKNYYGEYSIQNNLYHLELSNALMYAGLTEEEIVTREYNDQIFERLLTQYPEQVSENYYYCLLNLLFACAKVKNHNIYKKYEDKVFQNVLNKNYGDSALLNLVYNNFISPNLYDFNQFEKAIEYLDFVIPKVLEYYGEFSVQNSLRHHERAYALASLGLIEKEILTREYNDKILEKLLSQYPERVSENYYYNLHFLKNLYVTTKDDLKRLKVLLKLSELATDEQEVFDCADHILTLYGTDTSQFSSYVDPVIFANTIISKSNVVGEYIIVLNGRNSYQYIDFLTSVGSANRILGKDEIFVNQYEEAFNLLPNTFYPKERNKDQVLFIVLSALSNYYFEIGDVEKGVFYDLEYLNVCNDFEDKILTLSHAILSMSEQPNSFDTIMQRVYNEIEVVLQNDNTSYKDKLNVIQAISLSYVNTNDFNMAQKWLRVQYDLMLANNASEKEMIEDYWISQAEVEHGLGNSWKAREILHQSFKAGNLLSKDKYWTMLNNQSNYLGALGQHDEALALRKIQFESIDTTEFDSNSLLRRKYLLFLSNLSTSYSDQKKFKEALKYSQKAYDFANKWFDRNSDMYLTVLNVHAFNLGIFKGKEQESIKLSKECLALNEKKYGKSSADYCLELTNLFLSYKTNREYDNADALFLDTYNYFRDDYIKRAKGLTKNELGVFSLTFVRGQASFLEYAIKRREDRPEFYKLVINDLLREHNLLKNRALEVHKKSSPQLLKNYKLLQKRYFENLQLSSAEINNKEIDFDGVEQDYRAAESQLYHDVHFNFSSEININNIQAKLLNDEVFIFNFLYSEGQRLKYDLELDTLFQKPQEVFYDFLIITKNDIKHLHLPRLAIDYWEKFDELQSEIQYKGIFKSNTHRYFQELIDAIKIYKHIYFCPEGRFGEINLETIFDYKTNKFLLENSRVEITTPNNFINGNFRKAFDLKSRKAVFFGAPEYDMDLQDYTYSDGKFGLSFSKNEGEEKCYIYGVNNPKTPAYKSPLKDGPFLLLEYNGKPMKKDWSQNDLYKMFQGQQGSSAEFKITNGLIKDTLVFSIQRENPKEWYKLNYNPLPFTDIEIDKCSNFLTQSDYITEVFKGTGATETALKNIDNPSVLHIATHSYFEDPGNIDNKSYTINNGFYSKSYWGNPELSGGILLSGCNDFYIEESMLGVDNGIVNAAEIAGINLSATDIVVMSSCESAKAHNGISSNLNGFMEGFQLAGARQMIATLWNVNDAKTSEFMTLFYEVYAENENASDALYQAKLKMFQKYDRAYWAPFVLIYL